jgi:hypothetical protein
MVSFYISNKQKARVVLLWLVFGVFKWAGVVSPLQGTTEQAMVWWR